MMAEEFNLTNNSTIQEYSKKGKVSEIRTFLSSNVMKCLQRFLC